jgi:hypothetical protein
MVYEPDHYTFDVCGDPPDGAGGCYIETPGLTGCLDPYCCMIVCDNLPYCCANGWDHQCVEAAGDICPISLSAHVVMADGGADHDARLDGFTITGGSAHNEEHEYWQIGGGMLLGYGSSPTISNCVFVDNSAEQGGALAVSVYGYSESVLVNCTFVENRAAVGGAVYAYTGSLLLVNCLFTRNTAYEGPGSAVYAGTRLVNCTVVDNFSVDDGIAAFNVDEIANCIFWDNGPTPILDAGSVTFSCVEGGHDGEGNIDEAPLFANAAGGDYRLAYGSPGIDAGSNAAVLPDHADLDGDLDTDEPTPLDLDLKGRILDTTVDMGAYEFCRRDLDGDGSIGVTDFLVVLAVWGTNPGHVADFDGSGDVGVTDFLALLSHWGPCR